MQLSDLTTLLAATGLAFRGGFCPDAIDGAPADGDGKPPATLILVGDIGGAMWPYFSRSPEAGDGKPDPLDRWTRRVVGGIAAGVNASAIYPFGGPPYWPFQRWAQRAESVFPSPLGILIHPEHGLWHAYRAALAFAEAIDLPPRTAARSPCESCTAKPCLSACPVGAFSGLGFDVDACAGHIGRPAGEICMTGGCLARHACPVAADRRHSGPQTRFHMAAFRRARAK
ncbi:MAG: ferredoxin [Dongiaceae bacterium]